MLKSTEMGLIANIAENSLPFENELYMDKISWHCSFHEDIFHAPYSTYVQYITVSRPHRDYTYFAEMVVYVYSTVKMWRDTVGAKTKQRSLHILNKKYVKSYIAWTFEHSELQLLYMGI